MYWDGFTAVRERSATIAGSRYWLRGGYGPLRDQWCLTADGAVILGPTTWEAADAALRDMESS